MFHILTFIKEKNNKYSTFALKTLKLDSLITDTGNVDDLGTSGIYMYFLPYRIEIAKLINLVMLSTCVCHSVHGESQRGSASRGGSQDFCRRAVSNAWIRSIRDRLRNPAGMHSCSNMSLNITYQSVWSIRTFWIRRKHLESANVCIRIIFWTPFKPDSMPIGGFGGPKFFRFHAVFGKILQNLMLAPPPPGELAPPTRGNPGSATDAGLDGVGRTPTTGYVGLPRP